MLVLGKIKENNSPPPPPSPYLLPPPLCIIAAIAVCVKKNRVCTIANNTHTWQWRSFLEAAADHFNWLFHATNVAEYVITFCEPTQTPCLLIETEEIDCSSSSNSNSSRNLFQIHLIYLLLFLLSLFNFFPTSFVQYIIFLWSFHFDFDHVQYHPALPLTMTTTVVMMTQQWRWKL